MEEEEGEKREVKKEDRGGTGMLSETGIKKMKHKNKNGKELGIRIKKNSEGRDYRVDGGSESGVAGYTQSPAEVQGGWESDKRLAYPPRSYLADHQQPNMLLCIDDTRPRTTAAIENPANITMFMKLIRNVEGVDNLTLVSC